MNNETKEMLERLEAKVASVRLAFEMGRGKRVQLLLKSAARAVNELMLNAEKLHNPNQVPAHKPGQGG
jgi:hypothetical protein